MDIFIDWHLQLLERFGHIHWSWRKNYVSWFYVHLFSVEFLLSYFEENLLEFISVIFSKNSALYPSIGKIYLNFQKGWKYIGFDVKSMYRLQYPFSKNWVKIQLISYYTRVLPSSLFWSKSNLCNVNGPTTPSGSNP